MLKKPNIIYVVPLRHIKEVVQDGSDYKEFVMEIDKNTGKPYNWSKIHFKRKSFKVATDYKCKERETIISFTQSNKKEDSLNLVVGANKLVFIVPSRHNKYQVLGLWDLLNQGITCTKYVITETLKQELTTSFEFTMAHEIDNIYMTPGSSIIVEDSVKKSTEKVTF